jgi:hypothetical protein
VSLTGGVPDRRRTVCNLWLRGKSVGPIAQMLNRDEESVRADLTGLHADWTTEFGSTVIGECYDRYTVIIDIADRESRKMTTPALLKGGFTMVSLRAGRRRQHLRAAARVHEDGAIRTSGTYIRRRVRMINRVMTDPTAYAAAEPVAPQFTDRARVIERLLVGGSSETDVAAALCMSADDIVEHVQALQAAWITTFGSIELALEFARQRDAAERMLDNAARGLRRTRDRLSSLQGTLFAANQQAALLLEVGHCGAAREARLDRPITEEEVATLRAARDRLPNDWRALLHESRADVSNDEDLPSGDDVSHAQTGSVDEAGSTSGRCSTAGTLPTGISLDVRALPLRTPLRLKYFTGSNE